MVRNYWIKCELYEVQLAQPNDLGISGGAFRDREGIEPILGFKIAPILRAQSAVRCMPLFGGAFRCWGYLTARMHSPGNLSGCG